jgi:Ca2+ transporting ATPase
MVTGDNVETAKSIAAKCRITGAHEDPKLSVMEGPEFRQLVLDADGNIKQDVFDSVWPRLRVRPVPRCAALRPAPRCRGCGG